MAGRSHSPPFCSELEMNGASIRFTGPCRWIKSFVVRQTIRSIERQFLLGMIFFFPYVNPFAYRITAFCGLLYGLFNLTHWFNLDTRWMGFLHLPLLIISLYALILPVLNSRQRL